MFHLAFFLLLATPDLLASPFAPAFKFAALDLENCRTVFRGQSYKANPETLSHILGFRHQRDRHLQRWFGSLAKDERGHLKNVTGEKGQSKPVFYFQLSFKESVSIGSSICPSWQLWTMKPGAEYPGDPVKSEDWMEVTAWPNQSGMRSYVFPPELKTRSVLCTPPLSRHNKPPALDTWRFYRGRLLNICPLSNANASEEYTPPPPHLGQRTPKREVKVLSTGRGPAWKNTGKDREGKIRRGAIDTTSPVWVMLSWRKRYPTIGLLPIGNCGGFQLRYFNGPENIPPKAGTRREWKKVGYQTVFGGILEFDKSLETRGIELTITEGGRIPEVARLSGMHAYIDLGQDPVPEFDPRLREASPLRFEYEMPFAGLAGMVIEDSGGKRLRNLFSLQETPEGKQVAEWDGKDMVGQYVLPGIYRWRAIASPEMELHYQFTAYPNITDNTPWQIGHHGPGGWLADHTPPMAACTFGDRIWFGAPVAESGVSFIECDLNGKKLTGWHSFEAWTGPKFLACDGETVFISHPKENDDPIWGYDLETRTVRTILRQPSTETRRSGMRGMAIRDGKLYFSVRSPSSFLVKPFGAPSVDINNCTPRYRPARKPRKAHEVVPNPQRDFRRLFRLENPPSGQNVGLTYLETEYEPGRRHHIVLALKKPQAIGSAVYAFPQDLDEMKLYLSVLKADAKYPPNPNDDKQWTVLDGHGKTEWEVVAFPENSLTRAVRITWEKIGGDPLAAVEEAFGEEGGEKELGLNKLGIGGKEKSGPKWHGRLEGMTFLRRRYRNLLPLGKVRVNSGKYRGNGEWWGAPKMPISPLAPGIMVVEWDKTQKVRGLAVKEIDGQTTEIGVYTGPAGSAIPLEGETHWRKVAVYKQQRRNHYPDDNHNPLARYLDSQIDFGAEYETRAIRLRVVEPFQPIAGRPWGVRTDRGGTDIDPKRCRIYGVAPLEYIGGEYPVDLRQTERISVYDLNDKKFIQETVIQRPGQITFAPDGKLFAISSGNIVEVDLTVGKDKPKHKTIIDDLQSPSALAIDRDSNVYVFDNARELQVVRVYDPKGNYIRDIGTPGGRIPGPWDVKRFRNVTSLAIDKDSNLWVVEKSYEPKRISKWTSDGEFIAEFLGPTEYGGGGVLDPYDKNRLFYKALEFDLDWDKGTSRLKNLTWTGPSPAGEVTIILNGRRYQVTRGKFGRQEAAIVYLYEKDHLKLAGAVGRGSGFHELREPEVLAGLGGVSLPNHRFTWSDKNGDGKVQAKEVNLKPNSDNKYNVGQFNRDLSVMGRHLLYEVKEILPNGVPVWEEKPLPRVRKLEAFGTQYYRMPNGNIFHFGSHHAVFKQNGELLWKRKTAGVGVHALNHAPPYHPGQACAELNIISHPTSIDAPGKGDLGPFYVTNSNPSAWNIWTHDGFLAAYLFRDQRHHGTPGWRMADHHRGLRLDNHHAGQEHFSGYFCRANDGSYYIVAGHNHASIVEIKGIDRVQRMQGQIELSTKRLQELKDWEIHREREQVYARAPVYDLYRFRTAPKIDGDNKDWDTKPSSEIPVTDPDAPPAATFKMGFDDKALYVLYMVRYGPLKNSGQDWRALFKTGASIDLQMSVNSGAPDDRQAPVGGDIRILMTYFKTGKPIAVLYQPVSPDAPEQSRYEVISPVLKVNFDEVRRLRGLNMKLKGRGRNYTIEASIPLKEIGFNPKLGQRYRFDWGILTTDDYGNACTGRRYWSNKATGILADAPSESLLMPHLWGHLRVNAHRKTGPKDIESLSALKEGGEAVDEIDVEEEFEE